MAPPLGRVHPGIVAMLEDAVRAFPGRQAVVMGEVAWTYAEFRRVVLGLARHLRGQGAAGGRVATVLPNSLLACAAPYAIAAAGAQHVPLNPLYTPRELDYILGDAKPTIVLRGDTSLPDRFADWLSQPDESLEPCAPPPDSLAILQYTGGSSGFPKGVNLT
ncbi:MAG TPA: AMP-binding protein, partial [Ramlibacter sp.]|nr:AMP-binding protein [Ramlibacter sp.]